MYYVKLNREITQEFWEMMAELWNGTYVLTNPSCHAVEMLRLDEISPLGIVIYQEVA